MTDITQEQAVKIAEWLGLQPDDPDNGNDGWYWINGRAWEAGKYLISPEGQSAVMDRLEMGDWDIFNEKVNDEIVIDDEPVMEYRGIRLQKVISPQYDDMFFSKSKTRQHALLLAVLEMLKDK